MYTSALGKQFSLKANAPDHPSPLLRQRLRYHCPGCVQLAQAREVLVPSEVVRPHHIQKLKV